MSYLYTCFYTFYIYFTFIPTNFIFTNHGSQGQRLIKLAKNIMSSYVYTCFYTFNIYFITHRREYYQHHGILSLANTAVQDKVLSNCLKILCHIYMFCNFTHFIIYLTYCREWFWYHGILSAAFMAAKYNVWLNCLQILCDTLSIVKLHWNDKIHLHRLKCIVRSLNTEQLTESWYLVYRYCDLFILND